MNSKQLGALIIIVVTSLVLTGCTVAPSEPTKEVSRGSVKLIIPASWQELTSEQWTGDNIWMAYADVTGSKNRQSVVVYHLEGIFNQASDVFNEAYCQEYSRLANASNIYEKQHASVQISASTLVTQETTSQCEVSYSWQEPGAAKVNGIDIVRQKGDDIYIIEATSVDGSNFEVAKQVALAATI